MICTLISVIQHAFTLDSYKEMNPITCRNFWTVLIRENKQGADLRRKFSLKLD